MIGDNSTYVYLPEKASGAYSMFKKIFLSVITLSIAQYCWIASAQELTGAYKPMTEKQLQGLFNLATRPEPKRIKILALRQVGEQVIESEVKEEARTIAAVLLSGQSANQKGNKVDQVETNLYKDFIKSKQQTLYKTLEYLSETKYRIDQTTASTTNALLSATNFDFTDVNIDTPADPAFKSWSYNYGARAASTDNRQEGYMQKVGLWKAGRPPEAIRLVLLTQLSNQKSKSEQPFDLNKARQIIDDKHPGFRVRWQTTNFFGIPTDEICFWLPKNTSAPVFRLFCNSTNYNQLFKAEVFWDGNLIESTEASNFDDNNFPWHWVKQESRRGVTSKAPIKSTTIDFLSVDFSPSFEESVFAFSPPSDFSVTDYSLGKAVIQQLPRGKIDGKMVEITNVVAAIPFNAGTYSGFSSKPFLIATFAVINIAALFLILRRAKPTVE